MKTTLLILAALAANSAVYADDLSVIQRPNGHGQSIQLYAAAPASAKVTVALYKSGRPAGAAAMVAKPEREAQLQAVSRDTGHGQATVQYVRSEE